MDKWKNVRLEHGMCPGHNKESTMVEIAFPHWRSGCSIDQDKRDSSTYSLCYVYTMFTAATAAPFQATVDKTGLTWDNVGGRDGQTWQAVIAVAAGPDF